MDIKHIYKTLCAPSYWFTLFKAVKGERRVDNSFFAYNFDTNMVEALKVYLIRAKEEIEIDYNADEIIAACDRFLDNRYKFEDDTKDKLEKDQKII